MDDILKVRKINKKTDRNSHSSDVKLAKIGRNSRRRLYNRLKIFFVFIIILAVSWWLWSFFQNKTTYQAVFLTNDQVYFGHLSYWPLRSTAALSDIYYLRADKPLQPQEQNQDQLNMELVKFGKEAHGPEDKMIIPKNQIRFWEDLRDDSRVTQTILEHKRQK